MLIVFGGLPGTGKTTIARELASQLGAVYLRIDSIEQAIRESDLSGALLDDRGYRVAHAVAEDNLCLGRTVIADCVNPIQLTRDAWIDVARRAHVQAVEVEVICSDAVEHRRRVETRVTDVAALKLPSWPEVVSRQYDPWNRERIVLDTAARSVEDNVRVLRAALTRPAC
jgi:predicted kinase